MRLQFHTTTTGDCVFIDTGHHLFLIDCGFGPNYQKVIAELGFDAIHGVALSHAHADHWAALPEVLKLLAPNAWLAKSGTAFATELMCKQKPYCKVKQPIDYTTATSQYLDLPVAAIPTTEVEGVRLTDLNADNSGRLIETPDWNHSLIHRGCLVPLIETSRHTIVLGTDLEGPIWRELYEQGTLPRNIDVFLAPNHGQKQGRVTDEVFRHLNPRYVIISDADPDENDNVDYYSGCGCQVVSLKEAGGQTVTINGEVEVEACK